MNEALKKAQKNYQDKCRIVNIRFNTETETDLIEWLDMRPCVSATIKDMIRNQIEQLKTHTVKVWTYRVEVKYSGSFDDYTDEDLIEMAKARMNREPGDYCEGSTEMNQFDAMKIDGEYTVDHRYPSNKLAWVSWTEIDENDYLYL